MVLQGPWIYNFLKQYAAPDFEWGMAAFPSVEGDGLPNVTMVETDALVIPTGAKHPEEAFEFIRYVNSRGPMEKLCLGHQKFTPLRECSPEFFQRHPNPYITRFLELAKSPHAHFIPQTTAWPIYSNDMAQAFDRIWAGQVGAQAALVRCGSTCNASPTGSTSVGTGWPANVWKSGTRNDPRRKTSPAARPGFH